MDAKTTDPWAGVVTDADIREARAKRRARRWRYVRVPSRDQANMMIKALRECGCSSCEGLARDLEALNAD